MGPSDVPVPAPTPTPTTPFPTPMPSYVPTPVPTTNTWAPTVIVVHQLALTLGMSGLQCAIYGLPEAAVVNKGLAAVLGLTADDDDELQGLFAPHGCADGRRRLRRLLTSSVAVDTVVSISSSESLDDVAASVSSALSDTSALM